MRQSCALLQRSRGRVLAAAAAVVLSGGAAQAQNGASAAFVGVGPQPTPLPPPIEAAQDRAYPGAIGLSVDATDLDHAVIQVKETVPVAHPGPMTLFYPRWLPGNHSPTGPIDKLAGLRISAGGRPVTWVRDPVDVYAFHVEAPQGAAALDLSFQFLAPTTGREGRVSITAEMLNVEWNAVVLYPAGYFTRDIPVSAEIVLPAGFSYATALETASPGAGGGDAPPAAAPAGALVRFKTTPLNTLVDSPLIAGRYFKRFDLDPGGPARVSLDVLADRPEALVAEPYQIAAHKALVRQAYKLFGGHHYDHYDFLLWLSERMGGEGLEHHQSSEDGTGLKYFTDWTNYIAGRDLVAHEFTHSWNGKYRRPADLWTPTFNTPMRDSLLWVYEGQTQYWGYVLSARSGLYDKQQTLDALALTAATFDHRVGHAWRPLEDTTNDPIIAQRRPISWVSWQRSEDYYSEAQLMWLDADTLIRERSGGAKSLDDFAALFFKGEDGSFVTKTYTFEDVTAALNAVLPYDWSGFLRTRLFGTGGGAPLDGLTRGGYALVYTDVESPFQKSVETRRKSTDLMFSLGFSVDKDAKLTEVLWDGPAFKAGLTEGATIVGINGQAYDAADLTDWVKSSGSRTGPLSLLVRIKDEFKTVMLDYHSGLRYPHLRRTGSGPARLDDILKPRT